MKDIEGVVDGLWSRADQTKSTYAHQGHVFGEAVSSREVGEAWRET